VGPLRIDQSSPSDVRSFAGSPDSIFHNHIPSDFAVMTYVYKFPANGVVAYSFAKPDGSDTWTFEALEATLQRFHTARGTHAGMTQAEAERREHLHYRPGCWAGLFRGTSPVG
jgi:hypothetical protein